MNRSFKYLLFVLVLVVAFQANLPAQCAMCKQAAETSLKNDPNSMARSLNSGILYLMAVPYLLIAFIFRKQLAQLWVRVFRKGAAVAGKD